MNLMVFAPVDEETGTQVVAALQRARTQCLSPVTALNQAGLLMTDYNARMIRHDTLLNASEAIRNTRMKHLIEQGLMPKEASPLQVAKALAQQVEWLADAAKRGQWR